MKTIDYTAMRKGSKLEGSLIAVCPKCGRKGLKRQYRRDNSECYWHTSEVGRYREGFRAGVEKAVAAGRETMTIYTLGSDLHFGAEMVVRAVQNVEPDTAP